LTGSCVEAARDGAWWSGTGRPDARIKNPPVPADTPPERPAAAEGVHLVHFNSLRAVIGLLAVLAGLAIAVLVPGAYAWLRYGHEVRTLELAAQHSAAELAAPGVPLHRLVEHDEGHFARAQARLQAQGLASRWRLLNPQGGLAAERGDPPAWPTIVVVAPLQAAGADVGTLQLEASLRPLLAQAGVLAALCTLLGAAAAIGLRIVPLRLLDRVLADQRVENLRFHTAINNMSQGLCFFDGTQRLIVCNNRYVDMYRLPRHLARPGTLLREIVDSRYAAGTFPDMTPAEYLKWRASIAVASKPSDTVTTLKDGRTFAIHHEPMPDGGWVATHEDITDRRRAQAQIERMARHDALTGLPNRVLFRERLNEAIGRGGDGSPLAVLCIDLDRFKAVNDTLGHPVGDELLRAAAQRLCECVRQTDLVARLGGDEFAIIQLDAPQPAASRALADRLVRMIAAPFEIAGHQVLVGATVGVVLSPDDGLDPDDLLKKADLALYDAKAAGRGTYSFFKPQMDEQAQGRRGLEIDLRQAIEQDQLAIHYQPIVSLDTDKVVSFEALLRWRHPVRGMVMPDLFIPLAEETGLIEPLGEWVLNNAFAEAVRWPAHVSVAVNLSPTQVQCGDLVRVVAAALARSGLAPQRVELEITESVRLAENSVNLSVLHRLHALGVRICLDDFGVGYSSLSYLRSFPFKKIKIDRSFVRDVVGNAEAAAIVAAIATLGGSLNMAITAEGVEEADQLRKLRELGCNEAQGYYLSRPRSAGEVASLLQSDRRLALVASRG
jgi:diguanylate cyclase (GGDEF)-like protein